MSPLGNESECRCYSVEDDKVWSRYPITESDSVIQVIDQLTFGMTVPLRSLQLSSSFEVTYVAAALNILLPSW